MRRSRRTGNRRNYNPELSYFRVERHFNKNLIEFFRRAIEKGYLDSIVTIKGQSYDTEELINYGTSNISTLFKFFVRYLSNVQGNSKNGKHEYDLTKLEDGGLFIEYFWLILDRINLDRKCKLESLKEELDLELNSPKPYRPNIDRLRRLIRLQESYKPILIRHFMLSHFTNVAHYSIETN